METDFILNHRVTLAFILKLVPLASDPNLPKELEFHPDNPSPEKSAYISEETYIKRLNDLSDQIIRTQNLTAPQQVRALALPTVEEAKADFAAVSALSISAAAGGKPADSKRSPTSVSAAQFPQSRAVINNEGKTSKSTAGANTSAESATFASVPKAKMA